MNKLPKLLFAVALLLAASAIGGCAGGRPASNTPESRPAELRRAAAQNSERAAEWLLAELLSPGGDSKHASRARALLDESNQHGMFADLARGLDDSEHGRLRTASDHFLAAARAARESAHPQADLVAWFAVSQAVALRSNTQGLWERWRVWVEASLAEPKRLGWRARDVLVDWWTSEAWGSATQDIEQLSAQQFGCAQNVRLAGPFGDGERASALVAFEAERPTPWPLVWPKDQRYNRHPRVLKSEQEGCSVELDEPTLPGIYYAETLIELARAEEVIIAVDNALQVWVNGEEVLNRDFRRFGSWAQVGAGVTVPAGTNRIVAKLVTGETSMRFLRRDGTPLSPKSHPPLSAGSPLLPSTPPALSFEANPRFVASPSWGSEADPHPAGSESLRGPAPNSRLRSARGPNPAWFLSSSSGVETDVLRYIGAYLAHVDSEDGVATLLLEPLVKDPKIATGVALSMAANFVEGDPIYNSEQTESLQRELYALALARDGRLWSADLERVKQLAKSKGLVDAVAALKELTQRYDQVPALLGALAKVYGELGWTTEHAEVVKRRARRFPDDIEGLYSAAQVLEEEGRTAEAAALLKRVRSLDPDSEVFIGRALERRDYGAALAELKRLSDRRPKREDLARRIEVIRRLAGEPYDLMGLLRKAIERSPRSGRARLNLADAKYAAGDEDALHEALVEALQKGGNAGPLKSAIDLVEGMTELEPYRLDGMRVIREYEAAGKHMSGTAARILDYMAVWVTADGASRSLEHQVIRLQSEEAIRRFAEHNVRGDLVLQMRVIKRDGRILEPEPVAGKPTVTFPHLEVGDYIETEQIFSGSSTLGVAYDGPHWFFREQDVAYARSEFVLISPAAQALDIEVTGNVPEPTITHNGYYDVRRWRVDASPAAPNEPFSVPPQEYLPSVKVSWGLHLERHLQELSERVTETLPVDPRIVRVAEKIVTGIPKKQELDRAKALYHWVLRNVQQGEEVDGRRVIVGKRGNLWRGFVTLCRSLGIPVEWAVARNRLAPEADGAAGQARLFSNTVLRVGTQQRVWLTLDDKHTPFGYVPAEVRGMPAYILSKRIEPVKLPSEGSNDEVIFAADVKLASDGSAELSLSQTYGGRLGANLRKGLSELAEQRMRDVIETQILANALRGARLLKYELSALDQPDVPFVVGMQASMAHFALAQGKTLRIAPPFTPRLSQFATLPTRQTAILLSSERRWEVDLQIRLPVGAQVEPAAPKTLNFGDHSVVVQDSFSNGRLRLKRAVHIRAGRITPEQYAQFVRFTRDADSALAREIQISLPGG